MGVGRRMEEAAVFDLDGGTEESRQSDWSNEFHGQIAFLWDTFYIKISATKALGPILTMYLPGHMMPRGKYILRICIALV